MNNELRNSEERSKKAMADAARLADELKQEQEHSLQVSLYTPVSCILLSHHLDTTSPLFGIIHINMNVETNKPYNKK